MVDHSKISAHSAFAWSVAEILRGDFKQSEYGRIVLPFVVLRRLDCLLEDTKEAVLEAAASLPEDIDDEARNVILGEAAGHGLALYNTSKFTFASLRKQEPGQIHENLIAYLTAFSPAVRDIFLDKFQFPEQLKRLQAAGLLWQVFDRFCQIDLHPNTVSNLEMGYLFEDLIRRFSEISNETAGEHFTPREVIRLIVSLLLCNDADALTKPGIIRTVYDPACGTGGMLSIAEEEMKELNSKIRVELYGQEINPESFAICKSDMLVTAHDPENIAFGNTLVDDRHRGRRFHYMLTNPPFGVDWKKYAEPIQEEHRDLGHAGRFGAGLPRISDGQFLFLQHMISKMREDEAGTRIGIVMNGSPLFTGGAASSESEIRRWLLENDWVEAIIALPTDLFYNTGIQTYVWIVTNKKGPDRASRVQLIDASGERFWRPMRKSLGSKRREIPDDAREEIVRIYHEALNGAAGYDDVSKILAATDFGYREIRVERPLRLNFEVSDERLERLLEQKAIQKMDEERRDELVDVLLAHLPKKRFMDRPAFEAALKKALKAEGVSLLAQERKAVLAALSERDEAAEICRDRDGNPESDPELRDYELVPLAEDWRDYVAREVAPFVPDFWVDESHRDAKDGKVGRVGYEINLNRYFYRYVAPRPLEEIDGELKTLEAEIAGLLKEIAA